MTMQVSQQKTQSAHRAARLRFALQMAEQAQRVGRRIAELREGREWTRPDLARQLPGLSTGNDVYRWERGAHLPRSDTLDAIAAVFGVEVSDLYAGPMAERQDKKTGTNGSGPIEEAITSSGESSGVARLEKKIDKMLARQTELLAEVGKVRRAQEAQTQTARPATRSSAEKRRQ